MRTRLSAFSLIVLLGTVPQHAPHATGSFRLVVPAGSYFSESRIPVQAAGINGPYQLSVLGGGKIDRGVYIAPHVDRPLWTLLLGASGAAVAHVAVRIVPPPPPSERVIAVATYRSGIALHDARTFAFLGNAAIGGPPADVAFTPNGSLVAPDTDGNALTRITRAPWSMRQISGVPEGNETIASPSGDVFVSNRDVNGAGGLTRIATDGSVATVITGITAEGLVLDAVRGIVYVGNVNDNTIAAVDAHSLRVLQKIPSVERPFGMALDERNRRLFVVSNNSPAMSKRGGYVVAIDLASSPPRIVRSSNKLNFPLGIAFDAASRRVFVTDEAAGVVYVLDAGTLRARQAPLVTCDTPWHPRVAGGRLYVPCARNNRVDVFSLPSLRRVTGAPFPTGVYPLSVAVSA